MDLPEVVPYPNKQQTYDRVAHLEPQEIAAQHTPPTVPKGLQKTKAWHSVSWYLLGVAVLLGAAVVGLAAGMGVEVRRANHAEALLAAASVSDGKGTPNTTATSYDAITRNCSSNAVTVTGTTYASYPIDSNIYTIYCYEDSVHLELLALFTPDFDSCMDACSSYNRFAKSVQETSPSNNSLACGAVTFTPSWLNRTTATAAAVDGNCFLKVPQTTDDLQKVTFVSEYHAALLND